MTNEQRTRVEALLKRGGLTSAQIAKQAGTTRQGVAAIKAWKTIREKRRRKTERMAASLPPVARTRKTGTEPLRDRQRPLGVSLLEFWQWSDSDLLSNATRGRLAEFLVAQALAVAGDVRREWVAYDLTTEDGVSVEVKSAAYVQTWDQRRDSVISFDIRPTLGWDPDTAAFGQSRKRQAQVYVFALLASRDRETVDPLDVNQWDFHVVPTSVLDARLGDQKTLSLNRLLKLSPEIVRYGGISAAVARAADAIGG